MKDSMNNDLSAGDYFVYPAVRFSSADLRIGRVQPGGKLRIVTLYRDGSVGSIAGRPVTSQMVKVPAEFINARVAEALEAPR